MRSSTIIRNNDLASEDIKYLSHGKVAFIGNSKEGTRPYFIRVFGFLLTQTNCLSRDILALLSLFTLIPREGTRIFASLCLPGLSFYPFFFLSLSRTSPPAGKTADFTSVRSSEHEPPSSLVSPSCRIELDVQKAPSRFGKQRKVFSGVVTPLTKLASGFCCSLPTFAPPLAMFIFAFRYWHDWSFRDCRRTCTC